MSRINHSLWALTVGLQLAACGSETSFTDVGRSESLSPNSQDLLAAPEYLLSFKAGTLETADIEIDTGFNLIHQNFALRQEPKTEDVHTQNDRVVHEDIFTQGHKGLSASQSFSISEAGIFDLLIVIDDSSSMAPYQKRIGKRLPSLLKHITNTNWRIAVVTTSSACLNKTSDGRKYLTRADWDKDSAAAAADFMQLINVGEFGQTVERGILTATQAMTGMGCASESNSWLRPDSQRAVLMVTDEKNCGSASNEGCMGDPDESASYFFDRVGTGVTFNAFLLLQDPPAADASNPSDPNHDCENSGGYVDFYPTSYLTMVQGTSGLYADICRSDYDSILEQISLNVSKKINIQYELAFPAVTEFTSIAIDGKEIKKFTTSGKTVTIQEGVSPTSSIITIKYKHSPVPMKKAFGPKSPVDAKTFELLVNNERLDKSQYQYNPGTGELELKNLPPENAEIKMRYRHDSPLLTSFAYNGNMVDGTMEVLVDGRPVQNFVVDRQQKRIIISEAPADGKSVRLRYEKPGDRTTRYSVLGAFPDQIENFELVDSESGEVLGAKLEGDQLVLPEAVVSEGRKVHAVYNLNYEFKDKVFNARIGESPYPGTVKVNANGQEDLCTEGLSIRAEQISFSCRDEDFEKVHLSYQFAKDYRNSFDLNIDYSGPRSLTVFVNDQQIDDYHVFGDQIVILKKLLPPGSEVKVRVKPL